MARKPKNDDGTAEQPEAATAAAEQTQAPAAAAAAPADDADDDGGDEQDEAKAERRALPKVTKAAYVKSSDGNEPASAVSLLEDACETYNINPAKEIRDAKGRAMPRELAAWKYYPAVDDGVDLRPAAVVLVTHGGLKLKFWEDPDFPMDEATEEKLRLVFRVPEGQALPKDLALPVEAIDGRVREGDYRYEGGYLRSGGKSEGDKRAERAERRARAGRRR